MSAPLRHEKPLGKIVFETLEKKTELPQNIHINQKNITSYIDSSHFNYAVDVLLPRCDDLPPDLDNILTDHPAYLARQVSIATLVSEEFRGCFMQRGKVYALSYGTCIDSNDCLAILPTGTLILHLTKDTFQALGLEGKASVFGNGTQKYARFVSDVFGHHKDWLSYVPAHGFFPCLVVEIDMVHDDFNPGKKLYERVKWCLNKRPDLMFDLLFTWQPVVNHICPTSIQNFFEEKNIVCNRVKIAKKSRHFKSPLPRVVFTDPENKSEENCGYLEMFEWLGACAIGADLDHRADSFVSSYTCPGPGDKLRSCVTVHYRGMFTPPTLQKAVQCVRNYMQEKNLPWCSVTVHGFTDAPVTQKMHEHGFHNNGDNLCTYLLFPEGTWVYTALGDRDVYT